MESRDEFNINADALQTKGKVSVGQKRGNPCRLYYEIYGKGDTKVVFINGMGTDRQMWELVVSVFKKTQPEFQMLTFDNRNTGYSDDGSTLKLTTREMAKDTLELIEGVGWSGEPINIVGTSMGGMIAMELSLLAPPDTIRTLTLSSTTSGRTLFGRECVAANIKCLFLDKQLDKTKVILEVLHSNKWLDKISELSATQQTNREFIMESVQRRLNNTKLHGLSSILGHMMAVFRHHVPDESLKEIGRLYSGRRIWILTGNRDNFIDHGNSEHMFTQIGPDAAVFRIFDGCGHSVATEELSSYTESLAAFIRLGSFPV